MNISKTKLEELFVDELARLQPTPGFMRLVKDRVLLAWREMKIDAAQRIAEIERKQDRNRHAAELEELDVEGILAFAERVSTERVEPLGPVVARSEAAAAAGLLSGRDSFRREEACWNRHNPAGFQLLESDF